MVAAWDPKVQHYRLFLSPALPFGAVASVYAFNRVARALRAVFVRFLGLSVTNYFDDYPQVEPEMTAETARWAAEEAAAILGWSVTTEPTKSLGFAVEFQALGVVFDFQRAGSSSSRTSPAGSTSVRALWTRRC